MKKLFLAFFCVIFCANTAFSQEIPSSKRNVILMIADGAGFSTFNITADYQTGNPHGMIYHGENWTLFGCSTFADDGGYDPATLWTKFETHLENPTDSSSASTTLHTGQKTKNGRISQDAKKNDLLTIAELAHQNGFAAGSITSVGMSHATPGAVAAHNPERDNGHEIFRQMLDGGILDVIIGGGHPEYDKNGKPYAEKPKYCPFGPDETTWEDIKTGKLAEGMRFIDSREDFQKLAQNDDVPEKLLGIAPVTETFQQGRSKNMQKLETSPTLAEASLAGLNVLNRSEKGFYLMIEGGAVDWANHNNDLPRMLEEMAEFNEAVAAVCAWVEANSSWDETLVIITADHDTGALWGPNADREATLFQPPTLKDAKYFTTKHSNLLVPLYVRGREAKKFTPRVRGTDEKAGEVFQFHGRYIDNSDVFPVMREALGL